VKSELVVRKRIQRLRERYVRRHIVASQERRHRNCAFNQEYLPRKLPYSQSDLPTELDLAPRKITTLLVIQDEKPSHLCMYGSDDPAKWPGDICDSDSTSSRCPMFVPRTSAAEARKEIEELLRNDAYVLENHRDLAALQWVTGTRSWRPSLWDRLWFWILRRKVPASPALGEASDIDRELEDLWR